ncbi:hypothetical protein [Streptomyces sp. NPDC048277]
MKLGKALATGVAEERPPLVHDEEPAIPEDIHEPQAVSVPEEAPAGR